VVEPAEGRDRAVPAALIARALARRTARDEAVGIQPVWASCSPEQARHDLDGRHDLTGQSGRDERNADALWMAWMVDAAAHPGSDPDWGWSLAGAVSVTVAALRSPSITPRTTCRIGSCRRVA
jgi:hypothetical protein